TSDAHYVTRDDAVAQDVLLCINTGKFRTDSNRMRMEGDQFFLRSPEEMFAALPDQADALRRSQEIADSIDIDLELGKRHFPTFHPPAQQSAAEYLRELCVSGLRERYAQRPHRLNGDDLSSEVYERLDRELAVINKLGFADYFLIVWDFVRFAKENGIPCTARGSACGALVAYLLGLGDVCPLEFDLLFERFLDVNRKEPPDIDIDFCRDRRQMVIDYTKEKYGSDSVAQIGTYGTLKAKAAIRDVGRALSVPLPRVNEVAKMIPETLGIKLKDALKESPELKDAYEQDPQVKELIDIAIRLEGLSRSAGTHAAGVVVADQPLFELLPLQKITGKEDIITQWDGPTVEAAGLLKMDFLGLRNLSILDKAVQNVRRHHGVEIIPHKLPRDDKATFALLQRGETKGIFQLESGGMRDLLTKMKPDKFADIIATSALYRPGPLEGGMVMTYVEVKHGRQPITKVHPLIDEILEETYGVMVYQEQVMRILNRLGGIELSSAYLCIKAISKKKLPTIAKFRDEFLDGAVKQDLDREKAEELFGMIEKFAGYGFNKSHSTAYGLIAYQTAYLKAHYPTEFMAALLSCGMESSERIAEHVDDARRMGITVEPPNVNQSEVEFTVLGDKRLAFGLGAIKGVGEQALEAIVAERLENGPYTDIFNLTERIDPKNLNRATLEALIAAGGLDVFGPNRAQHMMAVDRAVQAAASLHRDRQRGQQSLFGGDDDENMKDADGELLPVTLPEAPEWTHSQKLAAEKEVFGFYLTSHPLTEYAEQINKYATHRNHDLLDLQDGAEVFLGGMISAIRKAATKKPSRNGHTRYVNFDLEDPTGVVRCIMWPEEFSRMGDNVEQEQICFVRGRVDRRGREPNVVVNHLMLPDEADKEFTKQLAIKFQRGIHTEHDMVQVRDVLHKFPGRTDVVLAVDTANGEGEQAEAWRVYLVTPADLKVSCGTELRAELNRVLGTGNYQLHSGRKRGGNGNGNGGPPPGGGSRGTGR
ncbi:MAG: DNA polymerase III subunit alpha, partial [Planctomycetaceae bacterium]|nr:DNA polymerase III subunit alpha [Planctomycetaceae bacterium]